MNKNNEYMHKIAIIQIKMHIYGGADYGFKGKRLFKAS